MFFFSYSEFLSTGTVSSTSKLAPFVLDKYKRSLADFENLRNRMNKQVADAKVFGIQGFCKVRSSAFRASAR